MSENKDLEEATKEKARAMRTIIAYFGEVPAGPILKDLIELKIAIPEDLKNAVETFWGKKIWESLGGEPKVKK